MEIQIGKKKIGDGHPCYIIAELSANHDGCYERAAATVRAAKEAGADAIKLQTYTANTLTIDCTSEPFQIKHGTIWDGRTLFDLYKEGSMPWEWQPRLKQLADQLGIHLFSTPFDKTAVDFLEKMNVDAYKIASYEITDIPLIEYVASKKKPIILSTGIALQEEIGEAIAACRRMKNDQIVLLKCTSAYPTPPRDANIAVIADLRERYSTLVGLSDHTVGTIAPVVAVTKGASMVEKHFKPDKEGTGIDASFSITPAELKALVKGVRNAENNPEASLGSLVENVALAKTLLGKVTYTLSRRQQSERNYQRSLFIVEDVEAGNEITEKNIRSIRPGTGLATKHLKKLLGKKFVKAFTKGTPLTWECIR